ncbi:hypothetical protein ABPG72_006865 [Tetrahymena utriculariae]
MDCLEHSTTIFCDNHPNLKVNFIKLSQENQAELKCEECIFDVGQLNEFISMQSIKMCNEDHIFTNWPPVTDYSLLQDIKAILKPDTKLIELLEFQFDTTIRDLVNYLEQEKKKMIQKIINLRERKYQILKFYNEISGKDKLKQLIDFNKQTIQHKINDLKQLISQYFQQKEQNTTILKEQLQKYKNQNISRFDDFEPLKRSIQLKVDDFTVQLKQLIQSEKSLQISQQAQLYQLQGKSTFYEKEDESHLIEIQDDLIHNKISIIKNLFVQEGQMYFKYNLTKQKYYTIRFKFNDEAGKCFIIGIVNQNDLQNCLSMTHLGKVFCISNTSYCGRVTKGSYFDKIQKNQILEMRVDIENQLLQFLDYPNYQSVNELNEQYYLNQDGDYFLAIYFKNKEKYNTCIDLIYFEEVQK